MSPPIGSSTPTGARLDPRLRDAIVRDVERHPPLFRNNPNNDVTAVKELQTRLRSQGFAVSDQEGEFGESTEKAVKDFQTKINSAEINQGSPVYITGEVRDQTWGALLGLTGPDKLEAGNVHAGLHKDEYETLRLGKETPPATQEQIDNYHHVFEGLAGMKPDDKVTPELARKVSDDLLAGRSPQVPDDILAELGLRMVETTRGDTPDQRIVYPTSKMDNAQFDSLMYTILGDTLAQHDQATKDGLIPKLQDPNEIAAVNNAVSTGNYQ